MTLTLTVTPETARLLLALLRQAPPGVSVATVARIALARGVEALREEVAPEVRG